MKKLRVKFKGENKEFLFNNSVEIKDGIDLRKSRDIMFVTDSSYMLLEEYLRVAKIKEKYTFKEYLEDKRIRYLEMPSMLLDIKEIKALSIGNRFYFDNNKKEIYLVELIQNKKKAYKTKFVEYLDDELELARKEVDKAKVVNAKLVNYIGDERNLEDVKKLYKIGNEYKVTDINYSTKYLEVISQEKYNIEELEDMFHVDLKEISHKERIQSDLVSRYIKESNNTRDVSNEFILER